MRHSTIFRSGNTHRITIPKTVMRGLQLRKGDVVSLDHVRDGVVEMKNVRVENDRIYKQRAKR